MGSLLHPGAYNGAVIMAYKRLQLSHETIVGGQRFNKEIHPSFLL